MHDLAATIIYQAVYAIVAIKCYQAVKRSRLDPAFRRRGNSILLLFFVGESGGDISMTKTTVSMDQGREDTTRICMGWKKGVIDDGPRSGYSFEGLELPYPLSSGAGSIRRVASEGFMENGET